MSDIVDLVYPDGYQQPDDLVGMTRLVVGTQNMGEKYLPADGRYIKRNDYPDLSIGSSAFTTSAVATWTAGNRPGNSMAANSPTPRIIMRDPKNTANLIIVSCSYRDTSYYYVISVSTDNGLTWIDKAALTYTVGNMSSATGESPHLTFFNNKYYIIATQGGVIYSSDLVTWTRETASNKQFVVTSLYTLVNKFTEFKNKIYTGVYSQITQYQVMDMTTATVSTGSFHTQLGFGSSTVGTNGVSGASGFFFASATTLYFYEPTTGQILKSTDGINFSKIYTLQNVNKFDYSRFPTFSVIDSDVYIITETALTRANESFTTIDIVQNFKYPEILNNFRLAKMYKHPTLGYFIMAPIYGGSNALFAFTPDFTTRAGTTYTTHYNGTLNCNELIYNTVSDTSQFLMIKGSESLSKTTIINADLFADMQLPAITGPNANLKYFIRVKR